jgi:hypothetical protein
MKMTDQIYTVSITYTPGEKPKQWFFTSNPSSDEVYAAINNLIGIFNPEVNQHSIDMWTDLLTKLKSLNKNLSVHGHWEDIPVAGTGFPIDKDKQTGYYVERCSVINNVSED